MLKTSYRYESLTLYPSINKVRCKDCQYFREGFEWAPTDKCFAPIPENWHPIEGEGHGWVPAAIKNKNGYCKDFSTKKNFIKWFINLFKKLIQ